MQSRIYLYLGEEERIHFRLKPWWMYLITGNMVVAFYPYLYLTKSKMARRIGLSTKPIMHHKLHHVKQQRRYGKWKWLLRYITNRAFRLNNEASAIAVELFRIKHSRRKAIFELYAKRLCSWHYVWCSKTIRDAKIEILDAFAKRL